MLAGYQEIFNPIDYCFNWTEPSDKLNPHDLGWFEWDKENAIKQARQARDKRFKEASKTQRCSKFSTPRQLVKRGGIGTNHPEIEGYVTVYGIQFY